MKDNNPNYSRMNRKKRRNKGNQLLNIMIGLVVVSILIVGAFIIIGGKNDDGKELATEQETNDTDDSLNVEKPTNEDNTDSSSDADESTGDSDEDNNSTDQESDDNTENGSTDSSDSQNNENEVDSENPGTVTIVPSDDSIIEETIINTAWKPVGTEQTGPHESKYDGQSVDWNEKKKAASYATGFAEGELIFWKIKNGGGPQKSVAIVSTKDKSKKYRVFLEWVDEKGWQPVKMDKLTTLDFEY